MRGVPPRTALRRSAATMDPVEATPTSHANYALISAAYAGAFGVVVRGARGRSVELDAGDLVTIGLATFTLTRVLTEQKVESWLRRPFLDESSGGRRRPRGEGMRFAVGELLACKRCTGSWVGLGLVGLRVRSPELGRLAAAVGTVGAINDAALAGFAWLAGRANAAATPPPDEKTPEVDDRPRTSDGR